MKAVIYCFSGTGNTRIVSDMVARELGKKNIETDVFSFDYKSYSNTEYPSPSDYDIVGIAYPIYGFNAPYLVNRFVKKLCASKTGQRAFVIKTSGEPFKMNNPSSSYIKRTLYKKGYNVTYEKHFLMPYNIMFRYPDALAKQMYCYADSYSTISAAKIAEGEKQLYKVGPFSAFASFICKLVWIGGPIIGLTYKAKKSKCTKCGLCARKCPMGNISMTKKDGRPKFHGHCMICMRCVMKCPFDAINAGILNPWKVNGSYKFDEILSNESITSNFVNSNTKGYFKNFNVYFDSMDRDFESYGIKAPRSFS